MMVFRPCEVCGIGFVADTAQDHLGRGRFCSLKCAGESRRKGRQSPAKKRRFVPGLGMRYFDASG